MRLILTLFYAVEKFSSEQIENWKKVKEALEKAGKTDSYFYQAGRRYPDYRSRFAAVIEAWVTATVAVVGGGYGIIQALHRRVTNVDTPSGPHRT